MQEKEKKDNSLFELNLNLITIREEILFPDTFKEYVQGLIIHLGLKQLFFNQDDLIKNYPLSDGKSELIKNPDELVKQILEEYPLIIRSEKIIKNMGSNPKHSYIDLAPQYTVVRGDTNFDQIFIRRLRQLDLLNIPKFLSYHLEENFEGNLQEFTTFIHICLRKHKDKELKPELIETVKEWLEEQEKESKATDGAKAGVIKGRFKREAKDKLTCLNQEQTTLLVHLLQEERFLLKDEYLTDLDAGRAIEILTGYSQTTVRQNLGKINLVKTRTNLKEVGNFLTRLQISVDKALRETK